MFKTVRHEQNGESLLSVLDDKNRTIACLKRQLQNQKMQLTYYIKKELSRKKIEQLSESCTPQASEESLPVNLAINKFYRQSGIKTKLRLLHERMNRLDSKISNSLRDQKFVLRKIVSKLCDFVKLQMEFLMEYDVVNDKTDTSSVFNVKHKSTGKMYRFQSILCANLSENEQKALMNKIKIRIGLSHPNVLRFYDHIQHKDVIYLKLEYCEHSTLASFIQKECINKDRQLHEVLICRMLYQIVFALKTVDCFMGLLSLDNIMLNDEYNIKLYNFFNGGNKGQKQKEIKMSQLGAIIFELCTLEIFEKSTFELKLNDQCYTNAFKDLLVSMIKDNAEIKKHINKILCHPTVLLQSSQWSKENCFIEKRQEPMKKSVSTELSENPAQDYAERLEKLRRREAALQVKEQLLKEQERKLTHREKKIQTMERTVKGKLQQAELYLKRCREGGKSMSSESSRSSSNHSQSSSQSKKMSYEDLDPNYVSCGDSDVFPTSAKLQVDKIIKPQSFSRTLSERRIRFKTSPLKDNNFIRKKEARKSWRHSKIMEELDLPKIQLEETKDFRRKPLFLPNNEYENDFTTSINRQYEKMPCETNNTVWTEETKKYAFEMLRLMNNEEKENVDVKHTHL